MKALHDYACLDTDELSFKKGEIIQVLPFEDPEDQVGTIHAVSFETKQSLWPYRVLFLGVSMYGAHLGEIKKKKKKIGLWNKWWLTVISFSLLVSIKELNFVKYLQGCHL